MPAAQTTISTPPQRLTSRSNAADTDCSLVTSMRTAQRTARVGGTGGGRRHARLVDVAEGHRRAGFHQPQRDAATQPRSRSGDQSDVAGQRRLRRARQAGAVVFGLPVDDEVSEARG